jgi:hypothetical protein
MDFISPLARKGMSVYPSSALAAALRLVERPPPRAPDSSSSPSTVNIPADCPRRDCARNETDCPRRAAAVGVSLTTDLINSLVRKGTSIYSSSALAAARRLGERPPPRVPDSLLLVDNSP